MKRISITLAAVLCLCVRGWGDPVPDRDVVVERNSQLLDFLRGPIPKFMGYDDPKTTLQEALQDLMDRYDVTFHVDEKAFSKESVERVLDVFVAQPRIPPMRNIKMSLILEKILGHIPVESGARYIVRDGAIVITTTKAVREMCRIPEGRELLPLIHGQYEKRVLEDVLGELSFRSDMNIVVDARAAEKAKGTVTAKFTNVPVDTAVRVVADMADLKSVMLDNVLYVTTRENADRLQAEEERKAAVAKPKDAPDKMPAAK
jgi:hypothetical protein